MTPADPMENWKNWTGDRTAKEAAKVEWAAMQEMEGIRRRHTHVGMPRSKAKRIWNGLKKHESSCLVQMRSGHISLG